MKYNKINVSYQLVTKEIKTFCKIQMFFTLCQVFKVPFLMSKKYEHKIALDDGSVIFFPLYAPLYKLY